MTNRVSFSDEDDAEYLPDEDQFDLEENDFFLQRDKVKHIELEGLLFARDKPSEFCIDGLPLEATRKLVARQMSMAIQLLVQIMLQAGENSEITKAAQTSLMELSNLRDTALKKAKLIEMNIQNVNSIRQSHASKDQQVISHQNNEESVITQERRLTRSEYFSAVGHQSSKGCKVLANFVTV
eukprot:gene31418-38803_t